MQDFSSTVRLQFLVSVNEKLEGMQHRFGPTLPILSCHAECMLTHYIYFSYFYETSEK